MDLIGNQMVQGPNESFSAASKGFKRHQTMNTALTILDSHYNFSVSLLCLFIS